MIHEVVPTVRLHLARINHHRDEHVNIAPQCIQSTSAESRRRARASFVWPEFHFDTFPFPFFFFAPRKSLASSIFVVLTLGSVIGDYHPR